jgi:PEP-CTERM/exosortase A-associated glycosyltransferase
VLNALPAIWVGRRHGVPVVYELRASWEDAAVDHGTTTEGSLRYRVSRGLESLALHLADQVTTICEGLRGDIAQRGVSRDKITVIPNAVDVTAFTFDAPPDEALRSRLGLQGATVLGFAGSFYGYEGLSLLIDAAQRMLPRHPDLRVLRVGGGPQDSALRAQAAAAGMADRVLFTGRVPHAEVQRYYELIDVLAYPRLPIRLTELVTPLKPLEAMAQGHLLVASDVGGHRELIEDGKTGILFRAGDGADLATKVLGALSLPDGGASIRVNGRAFVERERSWKRSVANYRDIYAAALGRPV